MKRKAIVVDMFYPGKRDELNNLLERFMEQPQDKSASKRDYLGVVVPHAGYVYSGQYAAYGYFALQNQVPDNIILLAPSHRFGDFSFSAGRFEAYETPLGEVYVNLEIVDELLKDEEFDFVPAAHNYEHSLEVQLPFIKKLLPNAEIVPILLGTQSYYHASYLADKIKDILASRTDKTVIVVSSDLSHYHKAALAEELDHKLISYVKNMESRKLYEAASNKEVEACGLGGILTLMLLSERLGDYKMDLLNYTHSGKTSGVNDSVVGYMAMGLRKLKL